MTYNTEDKAANGEAAIAAVTTSGINAIDSLLYGTKWSDNVISFSFPTAITEYPDYAVAETPSGFMALSPLQQQAARSALNAWASVCNLTASETTGGNGTIRFGTTSDATTSFAFMPSDSGYGGDVWFGNSNVYSPTDPVAGNYDDSTFLHEIGHALGLKHPHENGVIANTSIDCLEYSVMSYRSYAGAPLTGYTVSQGSYPTTPMMDDIAVMQYMYGANYNDHAGNTLYKFDPSQNKYFETIWDGGGNDTYDLSAYSTDLKIDLQPGAWSTFSAGQLAGLGDGHYARGNVANALLYNGDVRSLIENAIGGSGNDILQGNQADNLLEGGAGSDTINGADGMDTLIGGAGADYLDGGSGNDQLWGGSGDDTLLGGTGSNGYWWGAGDGADVVKESESNSGDILIMPDIELSACTVKKSSNDLVFGRADGSTLTLPGWYALAVTNRIQSWVFGDTALAWNDGAGAIVNLADDCYQLKAVHKAAAGDGKSSRILGSSGSDILTGGSAVNQLWGAGGNDTLLGGTGSNAFWWGAGDGQDIIEESASNKHDTMILYNVSQATYSVSQSGTNLILGTADGSNANLSNWFGLAAENRIQSWVFGDTAWAWNAGAAVWVDLFDDCYELKDLHKVVVGDTGTATLIGNSGADSLTMGSGGGELWGAAGNDTLIGGSGQDVFWWGAGDGNDVIMASAVNSKDVVKLYNQVISNIRTSIVGSDLVISLYNDSMDTLTIQNWTQGVGYQISNFIIGDKGYQLASDGATWKTS